MVRPGHDLVVVGAGIVGLAVAGMAAAPARGLGGGAGTRTRSGATPDRPQLGVIHGGIYYQPGSLKARLCVEGARLMYEYCEQHRIPHERCGKLIVAVSADELPRLDDLEARGISTRFPGCGASGPTKSPTSSPMPLDCKPCMRRTPGSWTTGGGPRAGGRVDRGRSGHSVRYRGDRIDGARTPSSAPAKPRCRRAP